jgi:hypothetical protein
MTTNHHTRKTKIEYTLTTMYCGMQRRSIERNIPCLPREDFIQTALANQILKEMFDKWVSSGFDRKLKPTVDRIVPEKGYVIGNIQFLTFSENVIKGNKENPRRLPTGANKRSVILSKGSQEIHFPSGKAACDFLGVNRTLVCAYLKKNKPLMGWDIKYG